MADPRGRACARVGAGEGADRIGSSPTAFAHRMWPADDALPDAWRPDATLAELLLSKPQIVKINRKDVQREPYFIWPEHWLLGSCPKSDHHLRMPENAGAKDVETIQSLIVGLNPGRDEFRGKRYFIGRAGACLRSDRYAPLWEAAGDPARTLVTNIVKISTGNANELESVDVNLVRECARQCFLAEVWSLPNLKRIFLLGHRVVGLFRLIALPELRGRAHLDVYSVRHPSFSWAFRDLTERLRKSLREPLAWPESAGSGGQ
jgi:uracil-DNA glycosylase